MHDIVGQTADGDCEEDDSKKEQTPELLALLPPLGIV
jgi:hypothetical protein